jgi:hypothetical protein
MKMSDVVTVPKHTVIQYVRNKKRVPYGVIVAVKSDGGYSLGYSLCNKRDRFAKKMALKIALGRACFNGDEVGGESTPHDIRRVVSSFVDRCNKYYKK